MKNLSMAMAVSVLMLASAPSVANPNIAGFSVQKPIEASRMTQSKMMQVSFNNKSKQLSEQEIYKEIVSQAKRSGFELKEMEAQKISHIVNGALENTPPEAASINITVTIHFQRPIKIEVKLSL